MSSGRLFYVVGPSGSGKDSLMRFAREHVAGTNTLFAHRYITRPADAPGENHVALTAAEFAFRSEAGLFAMQWESHGLQYGVGREIDTWLAQEADVVVNGSRAYLPELKAGYPAAMVVCIDAPDAVLRERLTRRQREQGAELEARLARAAAFRGHMTPDMIRIDNGGVLEEAGQVLLNVLRGETA